MKTPARATIRLMLCLLAWLWMLAVPAIPHHHHADGTLCMKNDFAAPMAEHCCHNTGCMAANFIQQAPTPTDDAWAHPAPHPVAFIPSTLAYTPARTASIHKPPRREALYDCYLMRAAGLRAPPFLV